MSGALEFERLAYSTSGGGGTAVNFLEGFHPNDAIFPGVNPAQAGSRNGRALLAFDQATNESVFLEGFVPEYYDGSTDLDVLIQWAGNGVVVGDVKWNVEFERINTSKDLDTDSFAAAQTGTTTTAGVDGETVITTISFTNAQADGVQPGDVYRIRLTRDASNAADTMAADAQVIRVTLNVQP